MGAGSGIALQDSMLLLILICRPSEFEQTQPPMGSQVTKQVAAVKLPVWSLLALPKSTVQFLGVAADEAPELAELQAPPPFWAATS